MPRVYVGNLDRRVTERSLAYVFREYGALRSVWIARRPPGFAFVGFKERRDALDAIRDLDVLGVVVVVDVDVDVVVRTRGVTDRCDEPGHFTRECCLNIGPGGLGSERLRRPSPPRYHRSRRSYSPHGRRSPHPRRSYSRSPPYRSQDSPSGSYSPRGKRSPYRRRNYSPYRGRSYSRSPPYRSQDSPYAGSYSHRGRRSPHRRSYSHYQGRSYGRSPPYHREDSPFSKRDGHRSRS